MPVGQAQAPLVIPSTSELAGGSVTPAVTPSAVAQMTDALRQGFLTADDIIQRTGKRAQLKEKADVLALTEAMSPGAVQARQQAQRTALVQSKLGEAQAEAELPLVQPRASLSASDIEEKQAEQTYGVGIPAFKNLSAEAGTSAPVTPEGKPDWAARAKLGIDLISWKQKRDSARERLIPVKWEPSADGSQLLKFNKQGELISLDLEKRLSTDAISPFQAIQPGTVQTATVSSAPQDLPLVGTPEQITKWRARLINEGVSGVPDMSDVEVDQLIESRRRAQNVQPQASITPSKPLIEPAAVGQRTESGFSLGPPKVTDKPAQHYTETQQKALGALVRGLASEDALLNSAQKDPNFDPASVKSKLRMDAYKGGTIGQLAATVGQITPAERAYASASNAWIQGLLRAESGAAIAAKEQTWYEQTFFPAVGDPMAIQQQKANLRKAIEQTFEQVIEGKMTPDEYAAFRDTIRSANTTSPVTATQGQAFEIQGVGKVFRGADGKMYRQ